MERNYFLDNAKVLLIFLVVFGHLLQPFVAGSSNLNTLYLWIYTFHMPAFILLSGFFAKGSGNRKYIMKLAKKLLVPYLIFQLLYTVFYFYIGKEGWQTGIFSPHWALWFLFSLFSWHILLSWFKKLPAALGIGIAVLIGLAVGYFGDIGHTFSLSRTFVFFPFFLAGYWITETQIMWVKKRGVKVFSLIAMSAIAAGIHYAPELNTGWLLASKSYGDLGMEGFGGIARLLVYVTAAVMVTSVLAWVPQKKFSITKLGTRTLYVYLLHGFFIQYFREAELLEVNSFIELVGLAILAAVIVLILSSKPVLGIWQPFIEGKLSIMKQVVKEKTDKNSTQTEP